MIDFGVHYLRNFVFRFFVNYNWSRDQLCFLGERVEYGRFEHDHMENWIDKVYEFWETEGE